MYSHIFLGASSKGPQQDNAQQRTSTNATAAPRQQEIQHHVRLVAASGKEQAVLLCIRRDGLWLYTQGGKVGACDNNTQSHSVVAASWGVLWCMLLSGTLAVVDSLAAVPASHTPSPCAAAVAPAGDPAAAVPAHSQVAAKRPALQGPWPGRLP